jgi:hypothetical protein
MISELKTEISMLKQQIKELENQKCDCKKPKDRTIKSKKLDGLIYGYFIGFLVFLLGYYIVII